jgi:uncharacterized protein
LRRATTEAQSTLQFTEIPGVIGESHAVPQGYSADIVIRWGDKMIGDAPEFDPQRQS